MDYFVPGPLAMDVDRAQSVLTDRKGTKRPAESAPGRDGCQKRLREALLQKPAAPSSSCPTRPRRHIPAVHESFMHAPGLIDDAGLNLVDWGSRNLFMMALGDSVYMCDARRGRQTVREHTAAGAGIGPVTSVRWNSDGRHFALGLSNSDVQLWTASSRRPMAILTGTHQSRVGSLAWHDRILSTGGRDGLVVIHDLRGTSRVTHTFRDHQLEVSSLCWSASGKQLASAGADHIVHVWDMTMNPHRTPYAHLFEDHVGHVRALAWCPFQSNLLASGGADHYIKLWDTNTGVCLKSVDTGSPVSALLWNPNEGERELLSSHCLAENQLTLWKYPSLRKIADLKLPIKHPMYMAQSPDGCTVASAGDGQAIFWNIFGDPEASPKSKIAENPGLEQMQFHFKRTTIWEPTLGMCYIHL